MPTKLASSTTAGGCSLLALAALLLAACASVPEQVHNAAVRHRDHLRDLHAVTVAASRDPADRATVAALKSSTLATAEELVRLSEPR